MSFETVAIRETSAGNRYQKQVNTDTGQTVYRGPDGGFVKQQSFAAASQNRVGGDREELQGTDVQGIEVPISGVGMVKVDFENASRIGSAVANPDIPDSQTVLVRGVDAAGEDVATVESVGDLRDAYDEEERETPGVGAVRYL